MQGKQLPNQLVECQVFRFQDVEGLMLVGFYAPGSKVLSLDLLLILRAVVALPSVDPNLLSLEHHVVHLVDLSQSG